MYHKRRVIVSFIDLLNSDNTDNDSHSVDSDAKRTSS